MSEQSGEEKGKGQISIADEYKLLLQGRRVSSRRAASVVDKKQPPDQQEQKKEIRRGSQKQQSIASSSAGNGRSGGLKRQASQSGKRAKIDDNQQEKKERLSQEEKSSSQSSKLQSNIKDKYNQSQSLIIDRLAVNAASANVKTVRDGKRSRKISKAITHNVHDSLSSYKQLALPNQTQNSPGKVSNYSATKHYSNNRSSQARSSTHHRSSLASIIGQKRERDFQNATKRKQIHFNEAKESYQNSSKVNIEHQNGHLQVKQAGIDQELPDQVDQKEPESSELEFSDETVDFIQNNLTKEDYLYNQVEKPLESLYSDQFSSSFEDHMQEFKTHDKVLPNPFQTKECFVQIGDNQFGKVVEIINQRTNDTTDTDQSDEKVKLNDIQIRATCLPLTSSVSVSDDSKTTTKLVDLTCCKFLARAYLGNLQDLALNNMSPELVHEFQDCLQSGESEQKSLPILLVQVISLKSPSQNQNAKQQANKTQQQLNESNSGSSNSVGNSIHRLHVILAKTTDQFKLYPVIFKRMKKGNLPTKRSTSHLQDNETLQNEEIQSLCYKDKETKLNSMKWAIKIQKAFSQNYLTKVQEIKIAPQNLQKHLFTIVKLQYSTKINERIINRFGILTSEHRQDQQNFAVVSLFRQSSTQKLRTVWIPIDDQRQQKYSLYSDLSLGQVSVQCLQKLTIFDHREGNKKLRQLQMLNLQESYQNRQMCIMLKSSTNDKNQQDNEQKQMNAQINFSLQKCRECRFLTHNSSSSERSSCSNQQAKCLQCFSCQSVFHAKCLQSEAKCLVSKFEGVWRCKYCIRCSICRSQEVAHELMTCTDCNSSQHFHCLSPAFKASLNPLYEYFKRGGDELPNTSITEVQARQLSQDQILRKTNLRIAKFRCESCISCKNCHKSSHQLPKDNQWSKDFSLCQKCTIKKQNKQFCPICELIWNKKTDGLNLELKQTVVKCSGCRMHVHKRCDRIFEDPNSQSIFQLNSSKTVQLYRVNQPNRQLKYKCSLCRKQERTKLFLTLLDFLIKEDRQKLFYDAFWKDLAHSDYVERIKRPMCFSMIKKELRLNSSRYLTNPKLFRQDVDRVFVNAKNFNANETEVYAKACNLQEKANHILNNTHLVSVLELNSQATLDEIQYMVLIRNYFKKNTHLRQIQDSLLASKLKFGLKAHDLLRAFQELQKTKQATHQVVGSSQKLKNAPNSQSQLLIQDAISTFAPAEVSQGNLFGTKSKLMWEQLTSELKRSDSGDKCWYSSPAKVSFSDARLLFEEMCYLCGAFGNGEDFLCCKLCAESFHPYCLPEPKRESILLSSPALTSHWRCYNCSFCEVCHSSTDWKGLLICDTCDRAYHYWCLTPQLTTEPTCSWKCPQCFKCTQCSTTSFFDQQAVAVDKANLDVNETFLLSNDFKLCYRCSVDQFRKSVCSICQEVTGYGHNPMLTKSAHRQQLAPQLEEDQSCQDVLKCTKCSFFSHISCSETSYKQLEQMSTQLNEIDKFSQGNAQHTPESIYECLDCILLDKLPSFYLKIQNELYRNLDTQMRKAKLLRGLLSHILKDFFQTYSSSILGQKEQQSLYIESFVRQNTKLFENDRLINAWLSLINTQRTNYSQNTVEDHIFQRTREIGKTNYCNTNLTKKEEIQQPKTDDILPEYKDLDNQLIQLDSTDCQTLACMDINTKDEVSLDNIYHKNDIKQPIKHLYQYLHSQNKDLGTSKDMAENLDIVKEKISKPIVQILANYQKSDDFSQVENRAILKIRIFFMKWVNELAQKALKLSASEQFNHADYQMREKEEVLPDSQPTVMQIDTSKGGECEKTNLDLACTLADTLVDNPQKYLWCVVCQQRGELAVTGRLIPFQVDQFVHVNCALYTSEVAEGVDEQQENCEGEGEGASVGVGDVCSELYNFFFAFRAFKNQVCLFCGLSGATMLCQNFHSKKCKASFHFPCAYKSGKVAFGQQQAKTVYCEGCAAMVKHEPIAPFTNRQRMYVRRRINILENTHPIETDLFQDMHCPQKSTNSHNHHLLQETSRQENTPRSVANSDSESSFSSKEGQFVQCNKWRPFYYDLFNRVGNLTVLSLDSPTANLITKLHTVENQTSSWHNRLKVNTNMHQPTKFASLRIFWKLQQTQNSSIQHQKSSTMLNDNDYHSQKSYYIFTKQEATEIDRNDVKVIKKATNRLVLQNLGESFQNLSEELQPHSKLDILFPSFANQMNKKYQGSFEEFFDLQIKQQNLRYPKFVKENTYLTPKVLQGFDKYPIEHWNDPGLQFKLQLNDLKVANFFFKSAYKIGKTQNLESFKRGKTDSHCLDFNEIDVFQKRQTDCTFTSNIAPKKQKSIKSIVAKKVSEKKNQVLESVFAQILRTNQIKIDEKQQKSSFVDQNEQLSVLLSLREEEEDWQDQEGKREDICFREMDYEHVMASLNKKTLKVKQKERKAHLDEVARKKWLQFQQKSINNHPEQSSSTSTVALYPNIVLDDHLASAVRSSSVSTTQRNNQQLYQSTEYSSCNTQNNNQQGSKTSRSKGGKHREVSADQLGGTSGRKTGVTGGNNNYGIACKFREAKIRPKLVEVCISKIHRNGLFACQGLSPGDIVIEYVGEKIRVPLADKREVRYEQLGVGDCYMFKLNQNYIIDATFFGSKARYINHSCQPNLISEYLTVDKETHIIFVATKQIQPGQELTFDYNFAPDEEKIECFCGTEMCRGRLT